jgi:hypothetical protein
MNQKQLSKEEVLIVETKLNENEVLLKKQKFAMKNELVAIFLEAVFLIAAAITNHQLFWWLWIAMFTMWIIQNILYYRYKNKFEKNKKLIDNILNF